MVKWIVLGCALFVALLAFSLARQTGGLNRNFDYRDATVEAPNGVANARLIGEFVKAQDGSSDRRAPYTLSIYLDLQKNAPKDCRVLVKGVALKSISSSETIPLNLAPADVNSIAGSRSFGFWKDGLDISYVDYELSFTVDYSSCGGGVDHVAVVPLERAYREERIRVIDAFMGI
jgi:hypothetical protein